jgi:hypothetical protein
MRRSPAVNGSAADALSTIVAQIEASSPGSAKLGIANALRGLGMRASAAAQARLGRAAPDRIDAHFRRQQRVVHCPWLRAREPLHTSALANLPLASWQRPFLSIFRANAGAAACMDQARAIDPAIR